MLLGRSATRLVVGDGGAANEQDGGAVAGICWSGDRALHRCGWVERGSVPAPDRRQMRAEKRSGADTRPACQRSQMRSFDRLVGSPSVTSFLYALSAVVACVTLSTS
jgi:hypothetical protein